MNFLKKLKEDLPLIVEYLVPFLVVFVGLIVLTGFAIILALSIFGV